MGHGDGGNHQVVGADGRPGALQVAAEAAIGIGAAVVERQRNERGEEALQQAQILGDAAAAESAVNKLCLHNRTQDGTAASYL